MPPPAPPRPEGCDAVLNGLAAIIYKEILQVRRDPATRFVFLIPVFQMIVFGYAINLDIQNIRTVVVDMNKTAVSRRLIERFINTGTFAVSGYADGPDEARRRIVAGQAKVAIIIPPNFGSRILSGAQATAQVLVDGSDSTVANNAVQTANAVGQIESMRSVNLDVKMMPVDVRPRVLFNPDLVSANFYVPGLVGIILQVVTVMLTAFSVVRERERGTLEQLSVTPVSKGALIIGKIVPYAVIGMLQTCFVLILMRFVFGVPIAGDLALLLGLSVLFLLPSLALGILVSTIATNQAEAVQVSLLIMLPSVLLSGFAFPRESMPLPIYALTFCIPVTYYVEILRGIILRGAGLWALWPQTLALAGFALVLVVLSAVRFQKRIQ